jgi:hypothetical protein
MNPKEYFASKLAQEKPRTPTQKAYKDAALLHETRTQIEEGKRQKLHPTDPAVLWLFLKRSLIQNQIGDHRGEYGAE